MAFRTGLRSLELRNDIETPISGISRSWSVVVSAKEEKAVESVQAFGLKKVHSFNCFELLASNRSRVSFEALRPTSALSPQPA